MTQDERNIMFLAKNNDRLLLELPTGYGKSKLALDIAKERGWRDVLIVIPRRVLVNNWRDEIRKWGSDIMAEYVTYVSFYKIDREYDCVIFDEAQHISERCYENIAMRVHNNGLKNVLLLSAKVGSDVEDRIRSVFQNLKRYYISTRQAINEERLPDPRVYIYSMPLDDSDNRNELYVFRPMNGRTVRISYDEFMSGKSVPYGTRLEIECNEKEYYDMVSMDIDRARSEYFATKNDFKKNLWLKKSGDRLKWLSKIKTDKINEILEYLKPYRTITFCSSIKQTHELSGYYINSKSRNSQFILDRFNKGYIDHITACDMLNEGVNLVDCQVGLYASLHSSERLIIQQLGKL